MYGWAVESDRLIICFRKNVTGSSPVACILCASLYKSYSAISLVCNFSSLLARTRATLEFELRSSSSKKRVLTVHLHFRFDERPGTPFRQLLLLRRSKEGVLSVKVKVANFRFANLNLNSNLNPRRPGTEFRWLLRSLLLRKNGQSES